MEVVDTKSLVSQEYLLRKVDKAVYFSKLTMRSWSHCTVIKERTYTTSPLWPTRWHNTWMNGWCCILCRKRRDCVRARSSIWVGSGRSICLQRVRADGQSALVLAVYAQAWDSAGQYPNRGFLLHSENRVSLPP